MKPTLTAIAALALALLPASISAAAAPAPVSAAAVGILAERAVGGPCSAPYDDGVCICLDRDVCTDTYGGSAISGQQGSYPSPSDGANVWGCYISPCPQVGGDSSCMWRSACGGTVSPGRFEFSLLRPVSSRICSELFSFFSSLSSLRCLFGCLWILCSVSGILS
jgi:hypothetical protein